ncbi:hypothetical protein [Actinotalea sp.]|uniref:SLAC1 family transporter n=1 Tax=Actinotalea sp. TaxID=1872145 RepID=UPI003564FC20
MTTTTPVEPVAEPVRAPRLAHLPVTFFATVMGLAGLALAWRKAAAMGAPEAVSTVIFWIALAVGAAVALAYAAKIVLHTDAFRAEIRHPVRLAFVPTSTIALLLLAAAGREIVPGPATVLWWLGAVGQVALTLVVLSAWISRPTFTSTHVSPAWFIPVVGLVVVPMAGVDLGPMWLSRFAFWAGMLLWLALLPIVLQRLFVHEQPLPAPLLPTLAVLVAPPSAGFLAWTALNGGTIDVAGEALLDVAVLFGLLFAALALRLRRLPFFLSWWAFAFPLAALSAAVTTAAATQAVAALTVVAWTLLAAVSALVLVLAWRTAGAMAAGRICVPE